MPILQILECLIGMATIISVFHSDWVFCCQPYIVKPCHILME